MNTIKEVWESFDEAVLKNHNGIDENSKFLIKTAFYSGAKGMFGLVLGQEPSQELLDTWHKELEEFYQEMAGFVRNSGGD